MRENIIRKKLDQNLPTTSTRMWSTDPFFYEMCGQSQAFDYIEFVAEYAAYDFKDLPNIARACELNNVGTMIKVDYQGRGFVSQKAVQAGFQSIMFVDHINAEQVRESVRLMKPKFPESVGEFGYPNARYIGGQPYISAVDHAKRLNETVLCFMIEKHEAVENIEEICSVPGVDMIQFGPSDYSMSRGWIKEEHTGELWDIQKHCIETALAHGVRPRCEIMNPEDAEAYIELGVKDFSLGDQMAKLRSFWNGQGPQLKKRVEKL